LGSGGVAVGAGVVAAASPTASHGGMATGTVFRYDLKTQRELPPIYPPAVGAAAGMRFGHSIAASGRYLIVGAKFSELSTDASFAFLYDIVTGALVRRIFVSITGRTGEHWGASVAIDGDRVVIGAPLADPGSGGAIAIHTISTNSTIYPNFSSAVTSLSSGDGFGTSVAIKGDLIVASAPGAVVDGFAGAGRVYFLDAITGIAFEDCVGPAPSEALQFGAAVTIEGPAGDSHSIRIGAPGDDVGGETDNGSIFSGRLTLGGDYAPGSSESGGNSGQRLGIRLAAGLTSYQSGHDVGAGLGRVHQFDRGASTTQGLLLNIPEGNGQVGPTVLEAGVLVVAADRLDVAGVGLGSGAVWIVNSATVQGLPESVIHSGNSANSLVRVTTTTITESVMGSDYHVHSVCGLAGAGTANQGVFKNSGNIVFGSAFSGFESGTILRPGTLSGLNCAGTHSLYWWGKAADTGADIVRGYSIFTGATTVAKVGATLPIGTGQLKALYRGRADNVRSFVATAPDSDYALPVAYKVATGVTAANDSAIYVHGAGTLYREGEASGAGFTFGQLPTRLSLNHNTISFATAIAGAPVGASQALFRAGTMVARQGDPVPGYAASTMFSAFLGETTSPESYVLFRASVKGGNSTTATNEALWCTRNGAPELVLRKGDPAPLLSSGVKISRFGYYSMAAYGDLLILATVAGPGITTANDQVLYYNRGNGTSVGSMEILLREGGYAPGCQGAKVGSILALDSSTYADFSVGETIGHYAVMATLVVAPGLATATDNLVILHGNISAGLADTPCLRQPPLMLRKGALALAHVGRHQLTSFKLGCNSMDPSGAGNTGLSHSISSYYPLATVISTFPDKSTSLMRVGK
jgi:FG-GAP repeat